MLFYLRSQEVDYGHPYGHPVLHLVQDDGLMGIRYVTGDLNAPVYRTRVHDDNILVQAI